MAPSGDGSFSFGCHNFHKRNGRGEERDQRESEIREREREGDCLHLIIFFYTGMIHALMHQQLTCIIIKTIN